ncbi:hypothetical protein Q4R56_19130, partial [Morganella morganii]
LYGAVLFFLLYSFFHSYSLNYLTKKEIFGDGHPANLSWLSVVNERFLKRGDKTPVSGCFILSG